MRRFGLLLMILLFCALPAFAYDKDLGKVWEKNEDVTNLLPAHQNYAAQYFYIDKETKKIIKLDEKVSIEVNQKTGDVELETVRDDFKNNYVMDKALHFKSMAQFIKDKEIVKKADCDSVLVTYKRSEEKMYIQMFKDEKKIKEEIKNFDDEFIHTDTLLVILQTMLLRDKKSLTVKSVTQDSKGMNITVDFVLTSTANPVSLSDEYKNIPEQFKAGLKSKGDVYVYTVKVKGLAGFFYPFKYYFAFSKAKPYEIVARWGGPEKGPEFVLYDAK